MNDLRERYDFLFDGSGDLTQETLLLYVFGPLENEARQAIEQHLEDCEMCRDAAEGIALLGTKEHAVSALAMTDAKLMERLEVLKQKVTRDGREALMNQKTNNEPVKLKAEKPQRRIGWYRYAAAASLLLVVGSAFWFFNQTMQNQAEGIAMGKEDSLGLFKKSKDAETGITSIDAESAPMEETSVVLDNAGTITSTVSGTSAPNTYERTPGSSTDKELNGASNGSGAGSYKVTVADANGNAKSKKEEGNFVAQKPSAPAPAESEPIPAADEEIQLERPNDLVVLEEVSADKDGFRNMDDKFKTVQDDTVSLVNVNNSSVSAGRTAPVPVTVNKGSSNDNFSVSNAANLSLTDASVAQAQYPGGMDEVQKYFDKVVYPLGTPKGYKGVITFEVKFDKKGKIVKSSIVQGVGEPLDTLLYMHLNKMPNWEAPQPYGEPFESTRLITVEVTVR
jgi:hypothetical protein